MFDILILLVIIAIFLAFIRFVNGPQLEDRVVAFDTMSITAVSLLILLSVSFKSALYLDVAFIFALIGFIGTIIFARFNILKGKND